jgi:hypothetical protein
VAGTFSSGSPYSGLLFYAQSEGVGEFYASDGAGGIPLLGSHDDWRTSWTQIVTLVVGTSAGAGGTGLLFYAPSAGLGAFYATDGHGTLVPLAEEDGWRHSWTHVLVGRLRRSAGAWQSGDPVFGRHDTVFYEGATGYTQLYEVDNGGGLALIGTHDLAPNLPVLTLGSLGGPFSSLLAYEHGRGLVVDVTELAPTTGATAARARLYSWRGRRSRAGARPGT